MKKFTGNFLFGEHGFGHVLRKIGLSMVAILMAVAVYAQPQDTYHIFAENVEDCYRLDNEYVVEISMRDFVEIDSLYLSLTYDDDVFTYEDVTILESQLSALSVTSISATGNDTLALVWDSGDNPQTIEPNNDTTAVLTLHFSLNGYQHVDESLVNYDTDLTWIPDASSVWNDAAVDQEILTWYYEDGSIAVEQEWGDIIVDVTTANCDGGLATATVTSPVGAGLEYSFNADDDYGTENFTTVVAPSTGHTVMVSDGECVSFVETFDADAQPPFSYTVQDTAYVNCPGGNGDIEFTATGGGGSYQYYIVPEADTAQVINDITSTGKTNAEAIAYLDGDGYNVGNRVNQLPVGFYVGIVVDANYCIDVRETANWSPIEVLDTLADWSVDAAASTDEVCAGAEDGSIDLTISGATPYTDGYNILANGQPYGSREFSPSWSNLAPGDYEILFVDSLGCQWDTTITIAPATEIDFEVDHTDASCEEDNGTLWIVDGSITGGAGSYDYWVYSTDPLFATADTVYNVADTAVDLAPNVYYVKLFDDNGCSAKYENINGDNAIKILSIDFELAYDPIECYMGSTDVTISVTNPGNHGFKFTDDGGATWYTGSAADEYTFEDVLAGTYDFGVWDTTIDCENYWSETITQPDSLYVEVIDLLTLEPSCEDATDGNVQVRGYDGTTFESMGEDYYYEYKFNDRAWEEGDVNNTFAAGTGTHTIVIRDYYGCTDTTEVTLTLTENIITVNDTMVACTGDMATLTADTVSWIHEPSGLAQGDREPVIYYSEINTDAAAIAAEGNIYYDTTMFSAGTYYFAAQDEWGCLSNVDTAVVSEPMEIYAEANATAPAGCYGTSTGEITVEAWYGIERLNPHSGLAGEARRYQYMITQSQSILSQSDWYDQVNWSDFQNDDPDNDSVMVIDVQAGTYYVAVRGFCAIHGRTDLIQGPFEVVVEGAEELVMNSSSDNVTDVSCNGEYDGAITGLLDVTSGGLETEGYIFTISGPVPSGYDTDNTTGDFTGLPAGSYTVMVETDSLGCMTSETFEIDQPDPLELVTDSLYVSCYNEYDGVIRYYIDGGTAPYMETTNNVGVYESVNDIPAERWNERGEAGTDEYTFDRRVRAGVYSTYIMDANGCIYGPVVDTIKQPAPLTFEVVATAQPSCVEGGGTTDDGQIWVVPSGGWDGPAWADWEYIVSIDGDEVTALPGDTVKFTGLAASTYDIAVAQRSDNSDFEDDPLITYEDYFEDWGDGWYDYQLPYQNPDNDCMYTEEVDLQGPDPIAYDTVIFVDEACYDATVGTGMIHLQGITGGTAPYTVWVEGPVAYSPSTSGVGAMINLDPGEVDYTWDDLVPGHYNVFIMDDAGCQLVQEAGEIEEPDSLMITNTQLVMDAMCYGGEGTIQIDAMGGTPPYQYAVDSALVPDDGSHPIPHDDLVWQDSDTFNVTAATWVAWVMDANGCVVGYATDSEGDPILQHRVTVLEPDPIVAGNFDQMPVNCYGGSDGEIRIDTIYGGNGGAWTIDVTGTDAAGNEVSESYNVTDSEMGPAVLDGLPASTDKDDADMSGWTADDYYTVTIYDNAGCVVVYDDEAYVLQPEPFVVELVDVNDAFICPGDLSGLFQVQVVEGGVAPYQYKWDVYTAEGEMVDTLSAGYGFTDEFIGYGGLRYHVTAMDANGCETDVDTFIYQPEEITFVVEEITCADAELASARVTAQGTPERTFRVIYTEIENDLEIATDTTDWFESYIDIRDAFVFDGENVDDVHYEFVVEDNYGCKSVIDIVTFDPVEIADIVLEVSEGDATECTQEVTISVSGGIEPYVVMINDTVITEMTQILAQGTNVITVMDAHYCEATETVVVEGIVRDTTVTTVIGEETAFVDAEAGIDTMLGVGTYEFVYTVEDCDRTLNVTVEEVPLAITHIQGDGDASDRVGDTVTVTATVTAVLDDTGFYMQDAEGAGNGIWVEWATTTDLEIGDGVEVTGEVDEVNAVTTIIATDVTEVTAPWMISAAVLSSPSDVAMEMYESVLVTVEGARAMAAVEGLWTIYYELTDTAVVDTMLYTYAPTMDNYYDVTGIVNGMMDDYMLEPRMESDIVDLTATPVNPELQLVEFKVYPNPFNDRIYIDNHDKLTRVMITNVAGQRVLDMEYPTNEIRTANLVSGVYIVSMFTEDGLAKSERIVKE